MAARWLSSMARSSRPRRWSRASSSSRRRATTRRWRSPGAARTSAMDCASRSGPWTRCARPLPAAGRCSPGSLGEPQGDRAVSDATPFSVHQLVDHLFRRRAGEIVATLTRILGPRNLELAEDVVQEALLKALRAWPFGGIPDAPGASLLRAAKKLDR